MNSGTDPYGKVNHSDETRRNVSIVRWKRGRSMAFQDAEGKWYDYFSSKELPGPIEVVQVL